MIELFGKKSHGRKKGQAAMEYLMTYGWAILVIVIVLAALAYFSGNLFKSADTCLPGTTGFDCGGSAPAIVYDAATTGNYVSLRIFNRNNQGVTVKEVICTNAPAATVDAATWTGYMPPASGTPPTNEIAAGSSKDFAGTTRIPCYSSSSTRMTLAKGTDFKGSVVIFYNFANDVDPSISRQAVIPVTGTVR